MCKWLIEKGHKIKVYIPESNIQTNYNFSYENIPVCKVAVSDWSWKTEYQLKRFKLGFLFSKKIKYQLYFRQNAYYINKQISIDHVTTKWDIIHYPHLGALALYKPNAIPGVIRISSSTALCQQMGGYGDEDIKIRIQEALEFKAMKKTELVFGPSKRIAKETEKHINKRVQVIETPYIAPLNVLDESIYNDKLKGKKYVLFFGSIGLIKGVNTIADVIADLLNEDKEIYYVFIGKKLSNELGGLSVWDKLVQNAGIYSNRVIYFDSLKHEQLFPIIRGAILVTLPSRVDNFPNTCIEAMANGKIVIGTIGNGFEQLIEHEKNGLLIKVDDSKDLLKQILTVLKMPSQKREEMEFNAQKRIEALKPDLVLNELLNLYRSVIIN